MDRRVGPPTSLAYVVVPAKSIPLLETDATGSPVTAWLVVTPSLSGACHAPFTKLSSVRTCLPAPEFY